MANDKTSIDKNSIQSKDVPKPNKQWVDRRTSVDDLLGIVAELLIESNDTQQKILLNISEAINSIQKVDELKDDIINDIKNDIIDEIKDKAKDEDISNKEIKPGDTGVSLGACNSGNIGSFIINNIIINGIAKADVTPYERIIVTPGGTPDEPYIVPLSVLIKGDQGVIAQDDNNNLISIMYGSEGLAVKQQVTGELITLIQGDQGTVAQDASNRLESAIYGDTGLVAQDINNKLISVMQGSAGNAIAQDINDNLIAVMKANYAGSLITVASDANGLMQTDVNKAEQIETLSTISTTHFTDSLAQYDTEFENINSLIVNKIYIRGVNIQSVQNLKYRLHIYTKSTGSDSDIDTDTYIDEVVLDMSDSTNAFQRSNTGQYKLNIRDLNILYEDEDETNKLHIELENLSPTSKITGASGGVQIDFKYTPRL